MAALLQLDDQFRCARHFVVLVIADGGRLDGVVIQELLRVPCVLARNQVNCLERADGAKGDVFEVPDWRGDQIKRARCQRRQGVDHGPVSENHIGCRPIK